MKCLQRCFCVLLCLVLLLGVFSVSVSAEELAKKPYSIYSTSYLVFDNDYRNYGTLTFEPGDGVATTTEHQLTFTKAQYQNASTVFNVVHHYLENKDTTTLFEGGVKTTVKLQNLYNSYLVFCSQCDYLQYHRQPYAIIPEITYTDGSIAQSSSNFNLEYKYNGTDLDLEMTFTPSKDVQKIMFRVYTSFDLDSHINHMTTIAVKSYLGEYNGDDRYNLVIVQPSEEAGLLSGILGSLTSGFKSLGDKISNVFTAITDGFKNMGETLNNVWNSIMELPSKIWEFIENGLKSLFVPDEEYIVEYKNKWELLLEDKLGAVWQVVDITLESWDNINTNDIQNTVSIPNVSIPLPDNESFSFGGESVQVVPSGFEFLADLCKTASGAFCTLMFVNGLRKRYDEVMGVEQ